MFSFLMKLTKRRKLGAKVMGYFTIKDNTFSISLLH